jgi:hypothetical protein
MRTCILGSRGREVPPPATTHPRTLAVGPQRVDGQCFLRDAGEAVTIVAVGMGGEARHRFAHPDSDTSLEIPVKRATVTVAAE